MSRHRCLHTSARMTLFACMPACVGPCFWVIWGMTLCVKNVTFHVSFLSESEIRPARLLTWCQKQTEGYRNVTITDLTSFWKSGMALCALIHRFKPQLMYVKHIPGCRAASFHLKPVIISLYSIHCRLEHTSLCTFSHNYLWGNPFLVGVLNILGMRATL